MQSEVHNCIVLYQTHKDKHTHTRANTHTYLSLRYTPVCPIPAEPSAPPPPLSDQQSVA